MSEAFKKAEQWCEQNPKWKRICDIDDSDSMMLSWLEIPRRDRDLWIDHYGRSAEDAWREFASNRPCRHRYGFIGDNGTFYDCVLMVPKLMNYMMVFEAGGKPGVYYFGGKNVKSSRARVK